MRANKATVMLTAEATIYKHTRGKTLYLSLPADLTVDSAFPFKAGDRVKIDVYDEDSIMVRKA